MTNTQLLAMTEREAVIRMARQAGFNVSVGKTDKHGKYHPDKNAIGKDVPVEWLERFAALAATQQPVQQPEPIFWYRPLKDGLYEGPVHHKSVGGKMMRDEKPDEWVPLYAACQPVQQPDALIAAAQAVIDRWDSPLWKDVPHIGVYIAALRAAIQQPSQRATP